jgi:hypothetical protein
VGKMKSYTIELTELEDGKVHLVRRCDGFNALELLVILYESLQDIIRQIKGDAPIYDTIERQVVKDRD